MNQAASPTSSGMIDIHSHLLPGIDDGCRNDEESLVSVRRLIEAGFRGTICTPHIWPSFWPENHTANIHAWTQELQQKIHAAGLDYSLWAGGEVRLEAGITEFMREMGVPTLAGSRYVLVDLWESHWPSHADRSIEWLQDQGYTVILAHPERMKLAPPILARLLRSLESRGVLLQGNVHSLTGLNGFAACECFRALLLENRFQSLALDMHRPDTLEDRLAGIGLAEAETSPQVIEQCMSRFPARITGSATG